jgi:hypothetical protein
MYFSFIHVLLVCLSCSCYSFPRTRLHSAGRASQHSSLFSPYQGPFYIPSRLSAQTLSSSPSSTLSIDDIAARWQVRKLGESDVASGINTITLLDKTLEDRLESVQMSRVGGLGLELR